MSLVSSCWLWQSPSNRCFSLAKTKITANWGRMNIPGANTSQPSPRELQWHMWSRFNTRRSRTPKGWSFLVWALIVKSSLWWFWLILILGSFHAFKLSMMNMNVIVMILSVSKWWSNLFLIPFKGWSTSSVTNGATCPWWLTWTWCRPQRRSSGKLALSGRLETDFVRMLTSSQVLSTNAINHCF